MRKNLLTKHNIKQSNARAEFVTIFVLVILAVYNIIKSYPLNTSDNIVTRLEIGLFAILFVFVINRIKCISARLLSIIVPSFLSVLQVFAMLSTGNEGIRIVLFFTVCTAISMMYTDNVGMLVYIAVANVLILVLVLAQKYPRIDPPETLLPDYILFNLCNALLYFACLFTQRQHTRSNERGFNFDVIMDTTPSFMVMIDDDARIEYISKSLADWLGIKKCDYVYKLPLLDLFTDHKMRLLIQEILESDEYYYEKVFELNNGKSKGIYFIRSSQFEKGKIGRFFEWYEITGIAEATIITEEATRAKSNFLANMSHEIRTPIGAIMGMTDLLMLTGLNRAQAEGAKMIKEASESLLKMINRILDYSKIDAGKMHITSEPFEFDEFLRDVAATANMEMKKPGIVITVQQSKDIPSVILGDEMRLKQTLKNIIDNAVEFTDEGCIFINCSCERLLENEIKLYFSVADTGRGLSDDDMKKLFNEFEMLDSHQNRDIVGTGLGLAISKKFIKMMGGNISVSGAPGRGTIFSFHVICKIEDDTPIAHIAEPHRHNALIYEDNPYFAIALDGMVHDLGINYTFAHTREDFEKHFAKGDYTHIFLCEDLWDKVKWVPTASRADITLMKSDYEHNGYDSNRLDVLVRPVTLATLVKRLNGLRIVSELEYAPYSGPDIFFTEGASVLLVDDNPVNLAVGDGLIRKYGIEVLCASNAVDAVNFSKYKKFDIIFMDLTMPEIDGIEAAKRIIALNGENRKVPIVALSAHSDYNIREVCREHGLDDYLSKPINLGQLHRLLLKYIPRDKITAAPKG